MKIMLMCLILAATVTLAVALATGNEPADSPALIDRRALAKAAELHGTLCGICHKSDRGLDKGFTPEKWVEIVNAMQAKKPDKISKEDAAEIAWFLGEKYSKKAGQAPEPAPQNPPASGKGCNFDSGPTRIADAVSLAASVLALFAMLLVLRRCA